jgi:hypothetical protein
MYIGNVFKAIMLVTATRDSHYCTCLVHLGRHDRYRIISIGQGKHDNACDITRDALPLLPRGQTVIHFSPPEKNIFIEGGKIVSLLQ